jgi:hypothetical protein
MNSGRLYATVVAIGLVVGVNPGETTATARVDTAQPAHPGGVPSYAFTTLTVSGALNTEAWGINNEGMIVGQYDAGNVTHGFVASTDGMYATVDVLGAVFNQATGINERNDIVGAYRLPNDSVLHAYLMRADGSLTNIDVPGATYSFPRGINRHDDVTFEAVVAGHTTAYLLSNGAYTNIEPPASFAGDFVTFSYASGIDRRGVIVGRYDTAATGPRGYLLEPESDEAYTTLHFPNAISSAAIGINNKGIIVGGYTRDGVRHGYVLIDNIYTTLDVPGCSPTIEGGALTCTTARKVNDAGQVVGFYGAGGTVKGFVAKPIKVKELVLSEGGNP